MKNISVFITWKYRSSVPSERSVRLVRQERGGFNDWIWGDGSDLSFEGMSALT